MTDGLTVLLMAGYAAFLGGLYYFVRRPYDHLRDRVAPGERAPAGASGFFALGMSFLIMLPVLCAASIRAGYPEKGYLVLRDLLVVTAVYSAVLLLLLPLLRRVLEPRACAVLWVAPPLAFYSFWWYVFQPRWVVRLPAWPWEKLALCWAVVAAAVLGTDIVRHLAFSRRMYRSAAPVTEERVTRLFDEEKRNFFERPPKRLAVLWCAAAPCPVALGIFKRRVLLPPGDYSDGDLRLIFRHELSHLMQEDAYNKFMLATLRALCWFMPTLWLGTRRASEDLERAADQLALLGADERTRLRYGELLLSSAAGYTGFSTCLSAGARPLALRLRGVLEPRKRLVGGFAVGLMLLLTFCLMGQVRFSTVYGSAEELIFADIPGAAVDRVMDDNDAFAAGPRPGADEALEYLRGLEVSFFYQGRDYGGSSDRSYTLFLEGDKEGAQQRFDVLDYTGERASYGYVYLRDDCIGVCLYGQNGVAFPAERYYYVEGGLDWAYLNDLLGGG